MIRVYQYGCLPPSELPDMAEDQLRLANRFWNQLVEIERKALEKNAELWSAQAPVHEIEEQIAQLDAQRIELREATNAAKRAERRATVPAERRAQIAEIGREIKELRAKLKATKAEIKEFIREPQALIFAEQKEQAKAARQDFAAQGLYWGTYNDVWAHFQTASQKARKEGAEMHFRRYTGEGTWTVQIQTESGADPATIADLFNSASRLRNTVQIAPVDFADWDTIPRSERRRRAHTTLRMRVASDGRDPVWVQTVAKMHRPIPPDAQIKLVRLKRERIARQWRYSVSITVDEPAPTPMPARYAVAIDIGWRRLLDGDIRVGVYMGDDDGVPHEIRLPARLIGGFDQADRIRSHRDEHFNVAVAALKQWLAVQVDMPEWLATATEHIGHWRSHGRLMHVVETWRDNRFDGDDDIFDTLSEWRKKERHLEDFEVNLRDRLVRWRREIYRVLAAKLAVTYATLLVEDMDLRQLSKRPDVEDGDSRIAQLGRASRTVASPGVLRESLTLAFQSRGREIATVDSKDTTRRHATCGNVIDADFSASIEVECPYCGATFDQDANACQNMLGMREPEAVSN